MILISWNVNGLRAIVGKGFVDTMAGFGADVVCLQETKLQAGQIDLQPEGYKSYWNYAERKGYSGTVIFTRREPIVTTCGIDCEPHDHEGRVLTLDMGNFFLVNTYTPNSQQELTRLDYRMTWEKDFLDYLKRLDAIKPVVLCGDLNVAHTEIDLANPKTNRRSAGFTDEERGCFSRLLEAGFVDSFRHLHPDAKDAYTWWSYRGGARQRNIGWRIDYFVVSERIADKISEATILPGITGSDHCPIRLVIDL